MFFDQNNYVDETLTLLGKTVSFRAYRGIPYVDNPKDEKYQKLNIFLSKDLAEGKTVNGYTKETAPIFMPNQVGGYMPGDLIEPGYERFSPDRLNATFYALLDRGYVVVTPSIRGRILKNEEGIYTGKAPACIVDYKAAVRFLRKFKDVIPGDTDKIITNGTSAGGALSSLMGSTGDHPDYEPYLKEIGAADTSDAIFAASCYCPIINLDHADMAYEWEFDGVNEFKRMAMRMEGGRPSFAPVDGMMSEEQIALSKELAANFPAYVNSLHLKDGDNELTLDENGNGSFKEYVESVILASAQNALDKGENLSAETWLTVEEGKATAMDFHAYAEHITRMKTAPAFDDVTMTSPENDLFGNETTNLRHFTKFSYSHNKGNAELAEAEVVKMLNPMNYVEDPKATKAKYFRVRHGEIDRDTSLAISAMFTLKLKENNIPVDYASPWHTPHAGDYDLEDMFAWIDSICK